MTEPSGRIRKLRYDFGEYVIEEVPGSTQYPSGDPISRDQETLVVFLHRKNYDDYYSEKDCG